MADATGSEFVVHPGAGHAFTMPGNQHHYHAEALRKSWSRALQMVDALRT
jgi:dienelactone hydrolase